MYQGEKPLEEKSKQSSSNYGSLSHAHGSSSSLSFSLSSMDDQPSTSGCSSDMAYGHRNNQVKKQKVKQYLRTLMSMVGPSSGRKMSTLSTLQHVVDSVRRITDPKKIPASQMCEMKHGNLPSTEMDSRLLVKSNYDLTVLVSMKKHVVHQVTPELMLLLEYPMDFWKGRLITDFMYKRDLLTFNSNIMVDSDLDDVPPPDVSDDGQSGTSDLPVKTFYIRFRSFKSIGRGFNLKRIACYKPFQVNLRLVPAEHSGVEGVSKQRKLMMLKCLSLESPYKENRELPEMRTFSMRHTVLSTISHIHSNAIPLLGYLPQDIIGLSIFEIFHPDDLPDLYNVYKQVIESKGQTIKQSCVRLKARNGEWVSVETEWSSFVDPWSKKLEFVMGQHTVVSAPQDVNVFEENVLGNRFSGEQLLEAQKYQQLIRKLLSSEQTPDEKPEARQESRRDSSSAPGGERLVQGKNFLVPDGEPSKNREVPEPCRTEDAEEETTFYNQLNYSQNIKRYLMSQCIPGNVQLTQTASLPPTTDGDVVTDAAAMEPTDFPVTIQFTKPPSYGSSTIVHVSEHREDTIPSPPQPPEIVDDPSQLSVPNIMFGTVPLPPQLELTQEALRKHTKFQERLLMQQAKKEDNIMFLEKQKDGACLKKRSLSDSGSQVNGNEHGRPKVSKVDRAKAGESSTVPGDVFPTPFGIPMVPISTGSMMPPNMPPSKSHPMFSQNPPPEFLSMQNIPMYMQQFPVMQVDPTTGIATPVMPVYSNTPPLEPGWKSQGIQWPYFQQTGVSFVPQVMGGFYQTLTGMFQPFPLPRMNVELPDTKCPTSVPVTSTTTTTITSPPVHEVATPVAAADSSVPLESSRLDSSTGNDTDSSLMYILEASSSINNSSKEDAMEKVKHVPPRKVKSKWFNPPSWLTGGKWTHDVKLQYQLPQRKLKNVLKADREALNKMDCGNSMITDQLRELLDSVSPHNKIWDEESDYLLFEDVKTEKDKDNAPVSSESSSCCSDYGDQESRPVSGSHKSSWRRRRSTLTEAREDEQPDIEEVYRRWQEERECDVLTSTQEDKDSSSSDDDKADLKKIGENDSHASNVSKNTSDITPSDQRSSEEAGSSLKESSDCSSKDQKDDSAESENELRTECALVDSLFVKLPRNMRGRQQTHKHLTLPFWLQEAEHSEDIAKTYQLGHMDIEDILSADRRALAYLSQPAMVIEQFKQLNQCGETENLSLTNCPLDKSGRKVKTNEEVKKEPSFLIDTSVFENLFLPTGLNVDCEKQLSSQCQADELSGEELMMLD